MTGQHEGEHWSNHILITCFGILGYPMKSHWVFLKWRQLFMMPPQTGFPAREPQNTTSPRTLLSDWTDISLLFSLVSSLHFISFPLSDSICLYSPPDLSLGICLKMFVCSCVVYLSCNSGIPSALFPDSYVTYSN